MLQTQRKTIRKLNESIYMKNSYQKSLAIQLDRTAEKLRLSLAAG